MTTADGQVSVSLDGKLPPNWPAGFPLAPGAKAAGSGSLAGSAQGVMVGVYTLSGSSQDAYNSYKSNGNLTVDSASSIGVSKAFVGTIKLGGNHSGLVTISSVGPFNGVVVILDAGGSTSSTSGAASTSST